MAALSCPEVMYGAYYPYLYGRGAARSFHHAPHFQYDRLNVQSGAGNAASAAGEAYGGGGGGGGGGGAGGAGALSSGSASSGAQSPGSPPAPPAPRLFHHARLRAKEEDLSAHSRHSADGGGSSESEGECGGGAGGAGGAGVGCAGRGARAQYVSANCVVFTHYSGDVAAVVDEHFARALSIDKPKESVPMVSRNLPASFFNAAATAGVGVGVGVGVGGGACGGVDIYDYDPWHQHYSGYGHAAHRHAAEYHAAAAAASHHNMAAAAGYGGLLLGRGMHHQYKPVEWGQHHPPLDPAACASYSYPPVHGLEAPVQDTSKDLYWF